MTAHSISLPNFTMGRRVEPLRCGFQNFSDVAGHVGKRRLRNFIVYTLKGLKPSTRIFIASKLTACSVQLASLAHEIAPEIKREQGQ